MIQFKTKTVHVCVSGMHNFASFSMCKLKQLAGLLLFILLEMAIHSCNYSPIGQEADSLFRVSDNEHFLYDFHKPVEKHYLPYVLDEISGLTLKHPNILLAIDDESGKVFEFSLDKNKVTKSYKFYKPDDFEGVEYLEDRIYALRSDGQIFHFAPDPALQQQETDRIKIPLNGKYDTEGLGYDSEQKYLLIACKENGNDEGKSIFAFAMKKYQFKQTPLFSINPEKLKFFWEKHRAFEYDVDRIRFNPSAIAVHPIHKHYYILSAKGRMLITTHPDGEILTTYPLSPRLFTQPEGICFDQKGDIYISSEGDGDRGYILKFEMQNLKESQ